ncbi:MAG: carboxypeptidase-like regulatory domain-containing protein [Verrucomicrobia bacterium]|nr:carboxypeptidase-like regulatory domain-containing protein [Verrucomicrobiota bacterium]
MSVFCSLALCLASQVAAAVGGQVRGAVVDPGEYPLPGAYVRLLRQDLNLLAARGTADHTGTFHTTVAPGAYTLIAWMQGFRARRFTNIEVRDGETTDVGKLVLGFAGCDAPGVMCDNFGLDPPGQAKASGYFDLNFACAADLGAGKTYCPEDSKTARRTTDLRITKDEKGVYLSPINGATVSTPNPPRTDCRDSNLGKADVRIDGLGPGDDICVRTHDGRLSHLFLVDDVKKDSLVIRFFHVTR